MWIRFRKYLQDYFGASQKEANGLLVAIFLLVASYGGVFLFQNLADHFSDFPEVTLLADHEFTKQSTRTGTEPPNKKKSQDPDKPYVSMRYTLFKFDPNSISESEIKKTGIPAFIIKNILSFRTKGGKFKIKNDIKKIYGVTDSMYQTWAPYILLPDSIQRNVYPKNNSIYQKTTVQTALSFDINTVDSATLEKVKGVGPKLASRIIKYRNKLGGFITKQQLKEVYGLDSMVALQIQGVCYIDPHFVPRKIRLQGATLDSLRKHPYIGYQLAKHIIAFQNIHGTITHPQEFLKLKEVPPGAAQTIVPYLDFGSNQK